MATIAIIGAATALLAALIAFAQDDIKKVLAYSTVSQLGFMFMGIGWASSGPPSCTWSPTPSSRPASSSARAR